MPIDIKVTTGYTAPLGRNVSGNVNKPAASASEEFVSYTLSLNPAIYLRLNDANGSTTAVDSSINSIPASYVDADGGVGIPAIRVNSADSVAFAADASFNTSHAARVDFSSNSFHIDTTQPWSISAVLQRIGDGNGGKAICELKTDNASYSVMFARLDTGYLFVNSDNAGSIIPKIHTVDPVFNTANRFNSTVCVLFLGGDKTDIANYRVYVDGVSVGIEVPAYNINNTTGVTNTVGTAWHPVYSNFTTRNFDGIIQDFTVFNYAISLEQHTNLFLLANGVQRYSDLYTDKLLSLGLTHLWKMDDPSEATGIADYIGSNPLHIYGSPTLQSPALLDNGNSSIEFDTGATGYSETSNKVDNGNDSPFSISLFFKEVGPNLNTTLFAFGTQFGDFRLRRVSSNPSGYGDLTIGGPSLMSPLKLNFGLVVGEVYHLVITYTGGDISVPSNYSAYINGAPISLLSASAVSTIYDSYTLIGSSSIYGTSAYEGLIDEVSTHNIELSAPQVASLYGVATTESIYRNLISSLNPEVYLRLGDGSLSDTTIDASGNSHNGNYIGAWATSNRDYPSLITGDTDTAVFFNDSDSRVEFDNASTFISSNAPWSLSAVVYFSDQIIRPICQLRTTDGVGLIWMLDGLNVKTYNEDAASSIQAVTTGNVLSTDTAHSIQLTFDGIDSTLVSSFKVYVDGVSQALTPNISGDYTYNYNLANTVGAYKETHFNLWTRAKAVIDEFVLFNTALTEQNAIDLNDAKNGTYTPPIDARYSDEVLLLSPVAYWRLNESIGSVNAVDFTGNGNDVPYSVSHTPALESNGLLVINDPSDKAVDFTGNTYASGGTGASVTGEFTVGFIVNASSLVGDNPVLYDGPTDGSYGIKLSGTSIVADGLGGDLSVTLSASTTHHVVITRKSDNLTYAYIDGVYAGVSASTSVNNPNFWTIGTVGVGYGSSLSGVLDEVFVIDSSVTEAQAKRLYDVSQSTPSESVDTSTYTGLLKSYNPLAYWRLGESSGSITATDEIGYRHGTYVDGPTLEAGGLVFDGNMAMSVNTTDAGRMTFDPVLLGQTYSVSFVIDGEYSGNTVRQVIANSAGSVGIGIANGTIGYQGTAGFVNGTQILTDYDVYHVVVTNTAGTVRIYINGALDITIGTGSSDFIPSVVGSSHDGTTLRVDGVIDEVALYASVLDLTQIDDLYQAGLDKTPTPASALLELTGYAPIVGLDITVITISIPSADINLTGHIPLNPANTTIYIPSGNVRTSGNIPSVSDALVTTSGNLNITGYAPVILIGLPDIVTQKAIHLLYGRTPILKRSINVDSEKLYLIGHVPRAVLSEIPTLKQQINITGHEPKLLDEIATQSSSIALTGNTPVLVFGHNVNIPKAQINLTGNVSLKGYGLNPAHGGINITGNRPLPALRYTTIACIKSDIHISGNTPSIDEVYSVGKQQLNLVTHRPLLAGLDEFIPIDKAQLNIAGHTPSASVDTNAIPGKATLHIQGHTPSTGVSIEIGSQSLTVTGRAPDLRFNIPVGSAALELIGRNVTINTGIQTESTTLQIQGYVPTFGTGISPGSEYITINGYEPLFIDGYIYYPKSENLEITGHTPVVSIGVSIPNALINITSVAPVLKYGILTDKANIEINGYAPTIDATHIPYEFMRFDLSIQPSHTVTANINQSVSIDKRIATKHTLEMEL